MFEVYSERTQRIIRRGLDIVKANQIAISYTETYSWIDGERFGYRIADENSNRGIRRQAGGVH